MVENDDPLLKRWDEHGIYHAVADLEGAPRLCDLKCDDEKPWAWGYLTYWPLITCLECLGKSRERWLGLMRACWNGSDYEWTL